MTEYDEEDFLQLSGLQHYAFCPRQWALIHLEQQWAENVRTVEGEQLHDRAHDSSLREKRKTVITVRAMSVFSRKLGVSGQCDIVEFLQGKQGVPLPGQQGLWQPTPVEYKRGKPKTHNADHLQLCAQALCLEEMLCCPQIEKGSIYYGEIARREEVVFTPELRQQVSDMLHAMHQLYARGATPKCKPTSGCDQCSLKDICLPQLTRPTSTKAYMEARLKEAENAEAE